MHKLSFDPFLFMWSQSNKQCLNTNKCFQSIESNLGLAKQARYPESKVNKIELIRPSIFRTEVNSGQIQMGGGSEAGHLKFYELSEFVFYRGWLWRWDYAAPNSFFLSEVQTTVASCKSCGVSGHVTCKQQLSHCWIVVVLLVLRLTIL